jgi:hypothetical protein
VTALAPRPPEQYPERLHRIHRPSWVVGFGALSLFLHLPGLVFHLFNSDEASIATMATVINRGGLLYHQTADRKPPMVPYLYAAVFRATGTTDLRPVRAVAALCLAATAYLLACEAERRYGSFRAGTICGVIFLVAVASFFPPDSQAAGFETFMLLPMTAAVIRAGQGDSLAAGLWLAVACLTKQTAVTTILPVAYLLWRTRGLRWVVVSGAVAGFVVFMTAEIFGPSQFVLWTVTGNGGYLALRGSLASTFWRGMGMTWAFIGINLGLVVMALLAFRAPSRASFRARRFPVDLLLWLVAGAIGVISGLRFFGHYYLQLYPPLALAATATVVSLDRVGRRVATWALALPAAVLVGVALLPPDERGVLRYGAIAQRVRAITRPTDSIFVWGQVPEIYWASGRRPATRFIHTGFLTGNSGGRPQGGATASDGIPGAWTMLAQDFANTPPDLIVDSSTTDIRGANYYPLWDTSLWPTVEAHYRAIGSVEGFELYQRITAARGH